MLWIRLPLSISSFLCFPSPRKKLMGPGIEKIDGTRRWRDSNPQPPNLIHDQLDHRTTCPTKFEVKTFFNSIITSTSLVWQNLKKNVSFAGHKRAAVVYFDQLSGACSTWKLVKLLFFSRFQPFMLI